MGIYMLCAVPEGQAPMDTNMLFIFSFNNGIPLREGMAVRPTHVLHRFRRSAVPLGKIVDPNALI